MSSFGSLAETRRLGAPVVRVFRVALGRDPDPVALQTYAAELRQGAGLQDVAADIAQSDAFRRIHGSEMAPDASFIDRIVTNILPEGAARDVVRVTLQTAADLGMDRSQLIATLADSPLGRDNIPLLPGLAPGAPPDDLVAYRLWVEAYDTPSDAELARVAVLDGPRITVAMTTGDSTAEAALRSLESLQRQTYGNWELLLTTQLHSDWPTAALASAACEEPRLQSLEAGEETASFGFGLARRTGELFCLLDAGDTLSVTALHEVVAAFVAHPEIALVYTDEDIADAGSRRAPRFKPAFSPDLLLAGNSIGQLAVYRVGLLDQLQLGGTGPADVIGGSERAGFSGQSDGELPPGSRTYTHYDLALRAATLLDPRAIFHLPAVLCHRAKPTADWPSKPDCMPRTWPGLVSVEDGVWPRLHFQLPDPPPLVSVIVPIRDRPDLLSACADGLLQRTDYPAIELLVVDNGSTDPDTLSSLCRLEALPNVRVLRRPGPFNFAALNNAAAAEATGKVLLLLNNDTEVLHADWLSELVSHAVRPDVGAVGARLLYPDGSIQHAGILLGPAGAAVHVGRHARRYMPGYDGQLACTRDLSAVTGACIAMRRDVFDAVGGMEEQLAVAWNDVDLCLRVREAGRRVIWTPHAVLLHREAVTRGLEAEDPTRLRFQREQAFMRERWKDAMEADPFLNPNLLASEAGPLVLTRPRVRRPWHT